jgi:hypothetical protein
VKRGIHAPLAVLTPIRVGLGVAAIAAVLAALAIWLRGPVGAPAGGAAAATPVVLPASLRDTGLYADWAAKKVAAHNLTYAPQYPLWSDGAAKRRWIHIPRGAAIDGSRADSWLFPLGTRIWKEFSFDGRRVETRLMERTASGWTYATYAWNEDESDAVLVPARGQVARAQVAPGLAHTIPSQLDCRACHEGETPVLGFSALQLSPDRDPGAVHAEAPPPGAVDLVSLVGRGLLRGLPGRLLREPPRIEANSPTERAALGYLHGNCGGCHQPSSTLARLGMTLAYAVASAGGRPAAVDTTFGQPSQFALPGAPAGTPSVRVAPGHPEKSVLLARVRSASPLSRMPPLGTQVVDQDAVALIEKWIAGATGPDGRLSARETPRESHR